MYIHFILSCLSIVFIIFVNIYLNFAQWKFIEIVYNATFWKFFWRVFPVEIWQEFIVIASLIASFCTMKASQGFSRVLNPNMQLKNHFNCNKSRFNLNFFRQIPSPESPKSRIIDNSKFIYMYLYLSTYKN